MKDEPSSHLLLDFIAGGIGGAAGTFVGYPFDTVKTRLQNPEITTDYDSTFDAITHIVREEGWDGLFKGIAYPLASAPLLNGVVFLCYQWFLILLGAYPRETATLTQVMIAGFWTGVVCAFINTPTELVKIQQQNMEALSHNSAQVPSAWEMTKRIYRKHGLTAFFRGFTSCLMREAPGYAFYFLPYEAVCRLFAYVPPEAKNIVVPWPARLLAAIVAGFVGWTVTFPCDVVKTRIQGFGLLDYADVPNPYETTWSTIVVSYKEGGSRVFFLGLKATLWRGVPQTVVIFGVYEVIIAVFT